MKKFLYVSVFLFSLSIILAGLPANAQAAEKGKNPPGPAGGPGAGPKYGANPPGPQGGPGHGNVPGPAGGPGAGPRWTDNPNKRDNPPGPVGGKGTDWKPQGGGFLQQADANKDGIVDDAERSQVADKFNEQNRQRHEKFKQMADVNQDGFVDDAERNAAMKNARANSGQGVNPPGPAGGPGAGPKWTDNPNKIDNPPGPVGGQGTDWKKQGNPPGPKGGPGFGHANPPGPKGGPGAGLRAGNPPGPAGGPGAGPGKKK